MHTRTGGPTVGAMAESQEQQRWQRRLQRTHEICTVDIYEAQTALATGTEGSPSLRKSTPSFPPSVHRLPSAQLPRTQEPGSQRQNKRSKHRSSSNPAQHQKRPPTPASKVLRVRDAGCTVPDSRPRSTLEEFESRKFADRSSLAARVYRCSLFQTSWLPRGRT